MTVLFVQDGFETSDILTEETQLMGFFDLADLLTQTQLEELLTRFAELGGDLDWREFADFFRSHGYIVQVLLRP